jgi:hypothetical protein
MYEPSRPSRLLSVCEGQGQAKGREGRQVWYIALCLLLVLVLASVRASVGQALDLVWVLVWVRGWV